MTEPTLELRSYFATPIVHGTLSDCDPLNAQLRTLFLRKEAEPDKYRNTQPFNTTRGAIFDSNFDLFNWPDPPVKALARRLHGVLVGTVMRLNNYRQAEMARFQFQYHAWFHVTRKGGAKTLHNHPNASWSLVYYVDSGDVSDQEERSGYIQLYDPRGAANMYQDPGNMRWDRTHSLNGLSLPPQSGQFLLFPSYLHHEVLTYWGERPRIVVAANAWIRHAGR